MYVPNFGTWYEETGMCNIEIIFFVFVIIFVYIAFVLFCLCKKSINWRLGQHDYEFQEIVKRQQKKNL